MGQSKRTKLTWDCATITSEAKVLSNAATKLTEVLKMYERLQSELGDSWAGCAKDVFVNEMCVDIETTKAVIQNIELLSKTLEGVSGIYQQGEDSVNASMDTAAQAIEEYTSA